MTSGWHWVQIDPHDPSLHTCGARRGPRGKTRCELPPDHIVAGNWTPALLHTGRNRNGAWLTWTDAYHGHRAKKKETP
jgi:hypothetical protein